MAGKKKEEKEKEAPKAVKVVKAAVEEPKTPDTPADFKAKLQVAYENAFNNAKINGKSTFGVAGEACDWFVTVDRVEQ